MGYTHVKHSVVVRTKQVTLTPHLKTLCRQTTPLVESKVISLRELELSWIYGLLFEAETHLLLYS